MTLTTPLMSDPSPMLTGISWILILKRNTK